ncbi:MAG: hypothetical protein AB8B85_11815, partial [Paracoccaceae bacterium]
MRVLSNYAVLGWGSLIWDLDNLAPFVALPWQMEAGPRLPMEFCRISAKRKMGLAVCLDSVEGAPCATHAVVSRRDRLADVISDLAMRERAAEEMIGGICLTTGAVQGRAEIAGIVRDWCVSAGWTGAVWTDLRGNYAELRGQAFSIADAMTYLQSLTGESLDEAVRYIHNAPATTDTPLRRALVAEDWWRDAVTALPENK